MKALKDAVAETLERVTKLDKNHEHSPGMQESIETSADLTALEKKGLTKKDRMRQRPQVCCGLHPRTWSTRPQAKKGVKKFHLCSSIPINLWEALDTGTRGSRPCDRRCTCVAWLKPPLIERSGLSNLSALSHGTKSRHTGHRDTRNRTSTKEV